MNYAFGAAGVIARCIIIPKGTRYDSIWHEISRRSISFSLSIFDEHRRRENEESADLDYKSR